MAKIVVGLFDQLTSAYIAIHDLARAGYRGEDLLLFRTEGVGQEAVDMEWVRETTIANPATYPFSGFETTAQEVAAALSGLGVPVREARQYSEELRRGRVLVAVRADEGAMADQAAKIIANHGALETDERRMAAPVTPAVETSTASIPPVAVPVIPPSPSTRSTTSIGFDRLDTDYGEHYRTAYSDSGIPYDEYVDACRFGSTCACDQDNREKDWSVLEPELRTSWESRRPGTWDRLRDAVRYGWQRARHS